MLVMHFKEIIQLRQNNNWEMWQGNYLHVN